VFVFTKTPSPMHTGTLADLAQAVIIGKAKYSTPEMAVAIMNKQLALMGLEPDSISFHKNPSERPDYAVLAETLRRMIDWGEAVAAKTDIATRANLNWQPLHNARRTYMAACEDAN
jgi:hypothetical protein